jgi:TDG/mug DNA glycosylase family protein
VIEFSQLLCTVGLRPGSTSHTRYPGGSYVGSELAHAREPGSLRHCVASGCPAGHVPLRGTPRASSPLHSHDGTVPRVGDGLGSAVRVDGQSRRRPGQLISTGPTGVAASAGPALTTHRQVPDLLDGDIRLLFVGINPARTALAAGAPFGHGSNRFYPALFAAGITDHRINGSRGLTSTDAAHLAERGVGITSLVARPTGSAAEVGAAELRSGVALLAAVAAQVQPEVIAVLGVTAYRLALDQPRAAEGAQHQLLAGASLWVVPNPSGRNIRTSVSVLALAYRDAAVSAGITCYSRTTPT